MRSLKKEWHFLFKEHIEEPQIWINSACQFYSWFDIINDSDLTDTNKAFAANCVDLKRQGLAKVVHNNNNNNLFFCLIYVYSILTGPCIAIASLGESVHNKPPICEEDLKKIV